MRVMHRRRRVRQLVPGRCRYCGARFFTNKGNKPRQFCGDKCRQAEFRATRLEGQESEYRYVSGDPTHVTITPPKTSVGSMASGPTLGDRPLPLNIMSGYRWPGATALDKALLRAIIQREIG